MRSPRYDRRRFMRRAGGSIAGLSAAAGAGVVFAEVTGHANAGVREAVTEVPFSPNPPAVVTGFLKSANVASKTATLQTAEQKNVRVDFTDDAVLWRDHQVNLDAFSLDEELVAEGTWRGNNFSAFSLITIYQSLYADVRSVVGDRVYTTRGALRFVPETRSQRADRLIGTGEIRSGGSIGAIVRFVPRDQEYVVLRVL